METKEQKQLVPWVDTIAKAEHKFAEIVKASGTEVSFATESMFAFQALQKNENTTKTAAGNLASVRDAIINVASIGLSLNPATQYAYLVPRDGAICLDVSYKGLIKLATDTGSMLWVRAELVYSNDTFVYHGPAAAPEHGANVFGDRGEFIGVYCIAKTLEGDILTEVMGADEIYKVRDTSMAWVKKKAGPWKDWFGEMARKTVIKRASKTWPRSDKRDRLARAIEVINQHEGLAPSAESMGIITEEQENELHSLINDNNLTAEEGFMGRILKIAGVASLSDIASKDYDKIKLAITEKIKAGK